jgi:glycosyltransferase involved in cell wall biosynthesis
MSTATANPAQREVEAPTEAVRVEFLGGLPVFARFGNCGSHPLFAHDAPPGYTFAHTERAAPPPAPPRALRALGALLLTFWMLVATARRFGFVRTVRTLVRFAHFVVDQWRATGSLRASVRFAHSRNFESQVQAPRDGLAFLTSVPYTVGQAPWVIEIEDPTTLFFPFVENGRTANLDVRALPCFAQVKALLEADHCRGIVTHMRGTAELLPLLFQSERIARKVTFGALGVPLPEQFQTHEHDGPIDLLFTNSWHQGANNFFLRGGLDVLEAFDVLRRRFPNVRLTLRSSLPELRERHSRMIRDGWVRVIPDFVSASAMRELLAESHIYLLPAARIHVVSLLQAMAGGLAVVASDGWGFDEYVEHGRTGLLVPGRHGRTSWSDTTTGMLREDYAPMRESDPRVVEGIVESVSLLVEQRDVRARIGRAARDEVRERFNLTQWNATLARAFDRARL